MRDILFRLVPAIAAGAISFLFSETALHMKAPSASGRDAIMRIVVPVSVIQTVLWGVLYYSYAVLMMPVGQVAEVDAGTLTALFSAALLISGMLAVPVGRIADARGGKGLLIAGTLLSSLLFFLWANTTTLAGLAVIWGGIGVAMAMTFPMGNVIFAQHMSRDLRRAVVISSLFTGFAATIFVPVAEFMCGHFGWRAAVLLFSAVCIACAVLAGMALPGGTGSHREEKIPEKRDVARHAGAGVRGVLRNPRFWAVAVALASNAAISTGLAVHLVSLLANRGYDAVQISSAVALMGAAQVGARAILALGGKHLASSISMGMLALALQIVAMLMLWIATTFTSSGWALIGFAITNGLVAGLTLVVGALITVDLFSTAHYGQVQGILKTITTLFRAIAASALIFIAGSNHAYSRLTVALAAISVASLIAFSVSLFLRGHRVRDSTRAEPGRDAATSR
jgi:MFS family permease